MTNSRPGPEAATACTRRDDDDSVFRAVLELNPTKILTDDDDARIQDDFFEWAREFKGFTEERHNREMFPLIRKAVSQFELIDFMQKRFRWAVQGIRRLLLLAKMYSEFVSSRTEALRSCPPLQYVVLSELAFSSIWDINSGDPKVTKWVASKRHLHIH